MKSKYRHIDIKPKLDNQHFSASISCKIKDRNNVISLQFNDNNMIDRFMQRHGIKNRFWVKINKCYRYILMLKTKRTVLPYEWFSHYIDLDIYGTKFKIICGYEQFLIARYGVNWKTPDTERKYWKERIIHSKHYRVRDKDVLKLWLDH